MEEFFAKLINVVQIKSYRQFITGSYPEIEGHNMSADEHLKKAFMLDVDEMYYLTTFYAFDEFKPIPKTYNYRVARIRTDGLHPGYARLIVEESGKMLELTDVFPKLGFITNAERHGPAFVESRDEIFLSNMNETVEESFRPLIVDSRDTVLAMHSPYWPIKAYKWITRKRLHGSPTKSLVTKIAKYGCDFVQVPHKLCSRSSALEWSSEANTTEWRFSFSKGELMIVRSWTSSTRIVYRALWLLNKIAAAASKTEGTALCTYYVKTLMLWATEDISVYSTVSKGHEFELVCSGLVYLASWLKLKVCPNYFIPSNNMMDHLIDIDNYNDIKNLYDILDDKEQIRAVIKTCSSDELITSNMVTGQPNTTYLVLMPQWLKDSLIIFNRMCDSRDNTTNLFNSNFDGGELNVAMKNQLSNIYCSLASVQRCNNASSKEIKELISEAESKLANNTGGLNESTSLRLPTYLFTDLLVSFFVRCDNDVKTSEEVNSLIDITDKANWEPFLNDDLMIRKCTSQTNKSKDHRSLNTALFTKKVYISQWRITPAEMIFTESSQRKPPERKLYRDASGISPTVNVSWFIAKVYLANHHYAIQHRYSATEKICDEIVEMYRHSKGNVWFAEKTIPFVLSTCLTSLYDAQIQAMLGFFSLCSFMIDKTRGTRSVFAGLCPVQFALYLKTCCSRNIILDAFDKERKSVRRHIRSVHLWNYYDCTTVGENCRQYENHFSICSFDWKNSSVSFAITKAMFSRPFF